MKTIHLLPLVLPPYSSPSVYVVRSDLSFDYEGYNLVSHGSLLISAASEGDGGQKNSRGVAAQATMLELRNTEKNVRQKIELDTFSYPIIFILLPSNDSNFLVAFALEILNSLTYL